MATRKEDQTLVFETDYRTFVLSIFEWPLKTGFYCTYSVYEIYIGMAIKEVSFNHNLTGQ